MNLNSIQKILVIRLSSLGDILLTTPVIRTIKNNNPGLKIDFLVRNEYLQVMEFNPHIDNVIGFNRQSGTDLLINDLKNNGYDLVLDLQNNLRSRKISSRLKLKTFRYRKPDISKFLLVHFKINLLKKYIPIPKRYSMSLPGLELDDLGLEFFGRDGRIVNEKPEREKIGFCPGSKHFTKMWPKDYFIELGKLLHENGFELILIGGYDDREVCKEISDKLEFAVNLSGKNDLYSTAELIKSCSLVVCNDSGLMHLASAVGTPLVTVFGSTVREFGFFPYKARDLVLQNNSLSCRPCSHIGRSECPKKHFKCMLEITPELVFNKIRSFLKEYE